MILEEEVVSAVLRRHSLSSADKFIQEVFWRTYWKGWLELRPTVWRDYRERVGQLIDELDRDAGLRDHWQAATAGETGIECFDAWAHELIETGYLHNHARMWFASIWIFTLKLPWELGADYFLRHLLDGDPASNTLSWRWVAGLQTRGKTYLAGPGNIAKYTEGRFAPSGRLSAAARPVDGPPPPKAIAPPEPTSWNPELPTGLLLTEEDLHPDFLLASGGRIRSVTVFRATERRSPLRVSPPVRAFVDGAFSDAHARVQDRFQRPIAPADGADPIESVVDWARAAGVRQVVTAYVPVGPTADAMQALTQELAVHEIALVPALRSWDQLSWPHATRGFFQFRQKIPAILSAMAGAAASAA
ncbi:MAG: FAD-binding domain-containing protein [Alphaproteobacteria bacterium]|nr:FAD-binding domain-containing protein [Alphaproteobacteria bacterium]